jgi:hypothetical protein
MEEQSEQRLEQRIERHETKMDYHHRGPSMIRTESWDR